MIRYIGVRAHNNRLRLTISVYQKRVGVLCPPVFMPKPVSKETYKEIVLKVLTKTIKWCIIVIAKETFVCFATEREQIPPQSTLLLLYTILL